MSSTYVDKPISLIEKKKQQWAKEREELAGLGGAPWSAPRQTHSSDNNRPFQRNRNVPKIAMANNNEFFRKDFTANNNNNNISNPNTRRSSLPPLYKNQYNSFDERGGETSGYGSDNPNQCYDSHSVQWNQSGYESSSSYKEDRPKWKDKTRFWETKENEPPNWVKRGLENNEEIIVSNTSPAESPQHDEIEQEHEMERPNTGNTGYSNSYHRTYIRGQNVPLDSTEIAEREKRRQIALAHQEAIRQQLEEREKKRREEREKRIKEEHEEELRIEREQEIERKRKEQELQQIREKQERERKRKEAIKEALEQAEREAKLEKMKMKLIKQNNFMSDPIEEKEKINNIIKENEEQKTENKSKLDLNTIDNSNSNKSNEHIENLNNNSGQNINNHNNNAITSNAEVVLHNEINNIDLKKTLNTTKSINEESSELLNNEASKIPASFQILTPRNENLAIVMPTPIDNLQNVQYAVLLPNLGNATNSAIPIAVPLISTDRSCNTTRTENRILTPTQYRNKYKSVCDIGTQTDFIDYNRDINETKFIKEKLNNLDYHNSTNKKDHKRIIIEERPKWGANRPPTRYLKQSEKDLLYQRRKMRQKSREKSDYKNSSDESPTGSPRSYRKNYSDKRHTRGTWRKNDHFFARNIRMYQTEIVPLESDKDQIFYRCKCECCCRYSCPRSESTDNKIEVMKIEHSPRERLPSCGETLENASYIIDKLTALHDGLLVKQEQWEKTPRTPSLSSTARNLENS